MRAIRIEQYGGPEVLQLQDIPVPVPGEGEVLVRMAHAGINVMDVGTREGVYANSETYSVRLPSTIGMEGAGKVEQLGAGVTGFRPGDRVAYCLVWNSYAEFAVVPAWQLVHVPPPRRVRGNDGRVVSLVTGRVSRDLAQVWVARGPNRTLPWPPDSGAQHPGPG